MHVAWDPNLQKTLWKLISKSLKPTGRVWSGTALVLYGALGEGSHARHSQHARPAAPRAHSLNAADQAQGRANGRIDDMGWEQKMHLWDEIYNDNQWELVYFLLEKLFQIDRAGCCTVQNRDNGKAETYPIWVHGFISWWMCVVVMVLCVCIFQHSDVDFWFYKSDMKIIEIHFFPWEPCFECIQKVIDPFRH